MPVQTENRLLVLPLAPSNWSNLSIPAGATECLNAWQR
jgi:hypothetical protein